MIRPLRFAHLQDKRKRWQRALKLLMMVVSCLLLVTILIYSCSVLVSKRKIAKVEVAKPEGKENEGIEKIITDLHLSQIIAVKVISETQVEIQLDRNSLAIANEADIQKQLLTLQTILQSPTIDRSNKTIDLRFENPVLK